MVVRDATATDRLALDRFLAFAARWRASDEPTSVEDVLSDDHNLRYVDGWLARGDFGVIAETADGHPVGGAWARCLPSDRAGYGFVATGVPELSIGVEPRHRSHGIGTLLLGRLIEQARERRAPAISLSVEEANPAHRLYERFGFVPVSSGGGSMTMVLALSPPASN